MKDRELKAHVVQTLRKIPDVCEFYDVAGRGHFNKKVYRELADEIDSWWFPSVEIKRFSPSFAPSANTGAFYEPADNIIYLPAAFKPSIVADAIIIHECTHAIQDGKKLRYTYPQHELAPFVAQALYIRHRVASKAGGATSRKVEGYTDDLIGRAADKVAAGLETIKSNARQLTLQTDAYSNMALANAVKELWAALQVGYKQSPSTKGRKKKTSVTGDGW